MKTLIIAVMMTVMNEELSKNVILSAKTSTFCHLQPFHSVLTGYYPLFTSNLEYLFITLYIIHRTSHIAYHFKIAISHFKALHEPQLDFAIILSVLQSNTKGFDGFIRFNLIVIVHCSFLSISRCTAPTILYSVHVECTMYTSNLSIGFFPLQFHL